MKTDLNLATAWAAAQQFRWPVHRLLRLLLLVTLVLLAVSVGQIIYHLSLRSAYQHALATQQQTKLAFDHFLAAHPNLARDPQLVAEQARIQAAVQDKVVQLKSVQQSNAVDNDMGSRLLSRLAYAVPDGVWLKSIQISQSGKQVRLQGAGLGAEQVLAFLDTLKHTPDFKQRQFSGFHMSEQRQGKSLQFTLSASE